MSLLTFLTLISDVFFAIFNVNHKRHFYPTKCKSHLTYISLIYRYIYEQYSNPKTFKIAKIVNFEFNALFNVFIFEIQYSFVAKLTFYIPTGNCFAIIVR